MTMEKQTDSTDSKSTKILVVKKWYWYVGLVLVVYLLTIGWFQIWFRLPLEIAKDPPFGIGRAIGAVGMLVLGIWLMKRGRKVIDKSSD